MAYQVIARKWRPQRFDDVIGQRGVTQTLRNAITQDRLAQAFVFAGPRGVGKTTTARILARALDCVEGPTETPCGTCDACTEIAEGRDIDVLEIDAATHTQVDNVREVIISGLAIAPVRDRFKVFIIDEVHQLSASSFNALLKSVEEPPPHVVFIMATTLLDKIPDTILSRSQVFEFRTIGTAAITEQLKTIAESEKVAIDDSGLTLIARSAEGSMRDAQSALDQVIAFAGESASAEEVSAVLGLVGRDAVFDVAETVADEEAPRVFELAGRFVEAGYDLRSVCRELSRLTRDLLVLKVDPGRIDDPEIAADNERARLEALAGRFSREDLLRGFDVLSKAEFEIRGATQPRYHFEVAMLRWMHLRHLVPLADLVDGLARQPAPAGRNTTTAPRPSAPPAGRAPAPARASAPARPPSPAAASPPATSPTAPPEPEPGPPPAAETPAPAGAEEAQAAFLAELKRTKKFFHGTVAAQAQAVRVETDTLTFDFAEGQQALSQQVERSRTWLEPLATRVIGRKMRVATRQVDGAPAASSASDAGASVAQAEQPALDADPEPDPALEEPPLPEEPPDLEATPARPAGPEAAPPSRRMNPLKPTEDEPTDDLLAQVMDDKAVQTMLEVFPAEIKDVEEM